MEFVLFKKGSPPERRRTKRFTNCLALEVSKGDHVGEPVIIQIGEGLGNPISAKAVKIKPRPGDVLLRTWSDKGKPSSIPAVLFAFVDISELKDAYKKLVDETSLDIDFFQKVFANDVVVRILFEKAISMCKDEEVPEKEKTAIRDVLLLVVATTLNTRSTLIQGEERLGQGPYPDDSPNPGKYPISSVGAEQIDLILLEIQEKCAAAIRSMLRNVLEWGCMKTVIQILLVHITLVIEHNMKHAAKQGLGRGSARLQLVLDYYSTAQVLLCYDGLLNAHGEAFPQIGTTRMGIIAKACELLVPSDTPLVA